VPLEFFGPFHEYRHREIRPYCEGARSNWYHRKARLPFFWLGGKTQALNQRRNGMVGHDCIRGSPKGAAAARMWF
jgi:hypothetical protein